MGPGGGDCMGGDCGDCMGGGCWSDMRGCCSCFCEFGVHAKIYEILLEYLEKIC